MRNHAFIDDEPLSDKELFTMLRGAFNDDQSCWETVHEAQQAYKDLSRRVLALDLDDDPNKEGTYAA